MPERNVKPLEGEAARLSLHIAALSDDVANKVRTALREAEVWYRDTGQGVYVVDLPDGSVGRLCEHLGLWLDTGDLQSCRALFTETASTVTLDGLVQAPTLRQVLASEWARWLEELLSEERLRVSFQPVVSTETGGKVVGHEVFLRGMTRDGAVVMPERLFDAAEALDRLAHLDESARLLALEELVRSRLEGFVFINVSSKVALDLPGFLDDTVNAAKRAGVETQRIVLELSRGGRLQRAEEIRQLFERAREAGFRCALDDLGGTPGTLRLMSEVKPEFAKLDRGLVTGIDADAPKQDLLRAYVSTARDAKTRLVGLGVEREAELDTLRAFGVQLAQGYLLGLPQSAESLAGA